jgi:hypothetical protein
MMRAVAIVFAFGAKLRRRRGARWFQAFDSRLIRSRVAQRRLQDRSG